MGTRSRLWAASVGAAVALLLGGCDGGLDGSGDDGGGGGGGGVPTITVTSPNGGETWGAGTTHAIAWSSGAVQNVRIEVSRDDWPDWETVADWVDASQGVYWWRAWDSSATGCRVRVTDAADGRASDESDGTFTLSRIEVNGPNGGELFYYGGPDQQISWWSENLNGKVDLAYSAGGGAPWVTIAENVPDTGSYNWSVPDENSTACRVGVRESGGGASDVSNGPFTIIPMTMDLEMTDLVLSGLPDVNQGEYINLDYWIDNRESGDADNFDVTFYISANQTLSLDFDAQMGSETGLWLSGNTSNYFYSMPMVPMSISNGTYYIVAVVDSGGVVDESVETNNTYVSTWGINIGATPGWDLYEIDNTYIEATSTWLDDMPQDHTLHVASDRDWLEVAIPGPTTAVIETYLLTGGVDTYLTLYDSDGTTVLAEDNDGGVEPSASRIVWTFDSSGTCYVEVRHPWAWGNPGDYMISVMTFFEGGDVDLVAQNVSTWPRNVVAGGAAQVSYEVLNSGTSDSAAFRVGTYMSSDTTVDVSDTLVDSTVVGGLISGRSYWPNTVVTVPVATPSGDYWFGVIADDLGQVGEMDEFNNTAIAIDCAGVGPDVAVTYVWALPSSANEGDMISVDHEVYNNGGCSLYDINVSIYLSRDANIDEQSDLSLTGRGISGPLAPDAYDPGTLSVSLPMPMDQGTWYIGVVAYRSGVGPGLWAPETDDTNNVMTTAIDIMGSGAPDLVVTSVSVSPLVAAPGEMLTVDDVTRNAGSAYTMSSSETVYYLATDPDMMFGFWWLGSRPVPDLMGDASDADSAMLNLPSDGMVPGGSFYLLARANDMGTVMESNWQNNVLAAPDFVSITGPDMDEPWNDTISSPGMLDTWMTIYPRPCTFHAAGDVDWFSLNFMMPGPHTVETSNLMLGADTMVELYRQGEETPLAIDDNSGAEPGASMLTFDWDMMNQYLIKVTHASGGTGHYMIQLREGP